MQRVVAMGARRVRGVFVGILAAVTWLPLVALADDWPQWRGPQGDNHADPSTLVPRRWDLATGQNVVWKTPLPGVGNSTPIVVGNFIFLTTSDRSEQTQSLLKLDRQSGRLLDRWVLHRGTLPREIHSNNTHASPTPAFDGERIYAAFHTDDSVFVSAVSTDGQIQWKKRVCAFEPSLFRFGYGASPVITEDRLLIAAEYDGQDSGLYALDPRTGSQIWKAERPRNLSFATPAVATIAGQRLVLLAGADRITAYDPDRGKEVWSVEAGTEAICGTIVWDDRRVLVSGGNPDAGTWCVQASGNKKLLWRNNVMCYEQSLLAINGYVFAVADSGVAYCWRTLDGKEMWKSRLFGGGISASPLLVGKEMIVASERGEVFTLAAIPDRFEVLARNQVGDRIFATPVALDDRLYIRSAEGTGESRREFLVALGAR